MFDPEFDPLLEMQLMQGEIAQQRATINKLINSFNQQSKLLAELSTQFVKITEQQIVLQEGLLQVMQRLDE